MDKALFEITENEKPVIIATIHGGHDLRDEVAELMAISKSDRLREEDTHTTRWSNIEAAQIVVNRSRFEVDMNRARDDAIYLTSQDAWGMEVWKAPPPADLLERSLEEYDEFYGAVYEVLSKMVQRFGRFVVYSLHSYNYRRMGPDASSADALFNPEINVGTGTMYREQWAPVVNRFITDLHAFDFLGRRLDVRENVNFLGREFSGWIHRMFPNSGCSLAIEVKKFYMDEWTGEADETQMQAIGEALKSTIPGVLEELARMDKV